MTATTAGVERTARAVAVGVWAIAVGAWCWRQGGIPLQRLQVLAICLSGLLAMSVGCDDTRGRAVRATRDWLPVAVLLTGYDFLRGAADWAGRPVVVEPVAAADRVMFGWLLDGVTPTEWLQREIPDTGTWWSVVCSVVYVSHFVVPFAVGALLWWRRRELWLRWRLRFLTVVAAALVVFFVVPVAPPWAASRTGVIGPVVRSASDGWISLDLRVAEEVLGYGQRTSNQFAAMPSLHAGFAVLTAIAAGWLLTRWGRLLAWAYPAVMGGVLVATAEHYVVDVLAGALLVVVVDRWCSRREATAADQSAATIDAGAPADAHGPITAECAVGAGGPSVPRPTASLAWLGVVIAPVLVAFVTRLVRLGRPRVFVFDEVFYVNDVVDLALRGQQAAALHPPLAKLLIAPFAGSDLSPLMWRLPVFVVGLLTVAGVGAAVWLSTRDRRVTALAGLLVAIDGLAFVAGRLALLEAAAGMCVVGMLVGLAGVFGIDGWATTGRRRWAPVLAVVAAAAGLATKWSVAPAAVVTIVALAGPCSRRVTGRPPSGEAATELPSVVRTRQSVARWLASASALGALVLVGSAVAWGPVLQSPTSGAQANLLWRAVAMGAESARMLGEHRDLGRDGPGHASAASWLLQGDSTVLYELRCADVFVSPDGVCRLGTKATAEIVARGNPVLWIGAVVAAGAFVVGLVRRRHRARPPESGSPHRTGLVVAIAMAGSLWLPWLIPGTAPYSFYGAAISPALAAVVALAVARNRRRVPLSLLVGATASAWFVVAYPSLSALT